MLVDAQLPPALARWLVDQGMQAEHVFDLGLNEAADQKIWEYARLSGAVILTKDEDFVVLSSTDPEGPAVIWVRLGNTTRKSLLRVFESAWPALREQLELGEKLVELRPS